MGIDLTDVVKVPRTRKICELANGTAEGVTYLCGTFCSNFVSPQQPSRTCDPHLHVGDFLVLVQEVVHVEFTRQVS